MADRHYNEATEMGRTRGGDDEGRGFLLPAYWRPERLPLAKFVT